MPGPLVVEVGAASVELAPGETHVVGRHSGSAVVVDHDLVSRRHLVATTVDGRWVVRDADSANGTFLDGEAIESHVVRGDVEVVLGDPSPQHGATVRVREVRRVDDRDTGPARPGREGVASDPPGDRPQGARGERPPPAHGELGRPLRVHALRPVTTIGRADDNSIVVNDLQASRHHAELRVVGPGQVEVRDLDSHNGTFVGGERIRGPCRVGGEPIGLGARIFRVTAHGVEEHSATDHFPVAAQHLRVVSPEGAVLLDDVSFALEEASLMAVLGPSGAGKSTLLGALTGIRPATSGRVLCAGRDLYAGFDDLSGRIGYVPQDDLVQPELTVVQSIGYAARLRFPPDVSAAERQARVGEVMSELGLSHRADVRVSALSGGQRKRVSIALELLTRPSLLYLDEPTSGLDPGYERSVMLVLRRLADSGRTVVLVTHSVESLHLCDRVLCLAPGGRTAWFGPPEETAAHFGLSTYQEIFQVLDTQGASDHAAAGSDADVRDPEEWKERFAASDAARRYVEEPLAAYEHALDHGAEVEPVPAPGPSVRGWFGQVATLTSRYARIVLSDRRTVTILAVTAPVLGLVLLLRLPPFQLGTPPGGDPPLFSQAGLVVFILAMGITQVATSTSVREIVKERAILRRERAVGVSAGAYVLSKVIVLGGLAVVQSTVIIGLATLRQAGPTEGLVLASGRLELVVVGALTALGAMALGLLVSALVRSPDRVSLILPAVLGFHLIVTSGEVMPAAPEVPVIEQARYLSTARWGFAAMAATSDVEQRGAATRALGEASDIRLDEAEGVGRPADLTELGPVPADLDHDRTTWWIDVGMVTMLTVVLLGATVVAVRRIDDP